MLNVKDYEFWFVAGSQHLYGEEALKAVEKNTKEIADYLNGTGKLPYKIVFKGVMTTADGITQFMKDAFGRNVIGYMEKPVKKYEFNNYMKAAVNILSLETVIHIDSETEVKSKDVLRIGTDNGYTEIEMITGRKITGIRKSMKAWEEELQQYGFMRINDACIINCRYVKGFEGDNVVIKDIGVKLRVSRRKKADCVKFYRTYRAKSSKYI